MRIDGKQLADDILASVTRDVTAYPAKGIRPTLAVIQVGDDPASGAYIRQKQKAADTAGIRLLHSHHPSTLSRNGLQELINRFNADPSVHGIIIQRPLPPVLKQETDVLDSVKPVKDVDGFLPGSPFEVPVALAVGEILQLVYRNQKTKNANVPKKENFLSWLREKKTVVIGRGETAGMPIFRYLNTLGCTTSQIHTRTPDPEESLKQADLIISCVGKSRIITKDDIKPGVILISVGIWRDGQGKLHGDYEEDEIRDTAAWHTPTPGGVGPVNVACLMQNVVKAAKLERG